MNVVGFQPLQLVTGKNVMIPGLTMGDMAMDSLYDDEMIRSKMEHHYTMMKEFRELEFSKKQRKASRTRLKEYEDTKISEGDLVFISISVHNEHKGIKVSAHVSTMLCVSSYSLSSCC